MHRYVVALGSNMRVPGVGDPSAVVRAAITAMAAAGMAIERVSPVLRTRPVGPSHRTYANAAALVAANLGPPALLEVLQRIESAFGRRRRGGRWRARTLDLDIVLWNGGVWRSAGLIVPHPHWTKRPFVLGPAAHVAPRWREPKTGRTARQLAGRAPIRAAGLPR